MGSPAADENYMQRAIELAQLGLGTVSPNPLVGCVIVKHGQIIGEGYHQQYGKAHAEVNAVNDVLNKEEIAGSDVYVTLEPCSHHGKTPPCSDLLISLKVSTVKMACLDPNPKVAGNGKRKLEDAGIKVEVGLLGAESQLMNRRFLRFYEKKRPYIIFKWAQTADGFIARKNYDSKWISNSYSRTLVHKWRAEEDAILVGKNTALYDDPKLNVRDWTGSHPIRILIDHQLQMPSSHHLLDGSIPTLVFNTQKEEVQHNLEWIKIDPGHSAGHLLHHLWERRIQSIIIEGGSKTIQQFANEDLWDEARVFSSSIKFGEGIEAPAFSGNLLDQFNVEGDSLKIIQNRHG